MDAAKHEFLEEAGYEGKIEMIPSYVFKSDNFTYYNYIGLIKKEFEPELNWETQDYRWVTYNELRQLEPKHFGLKALIKNDDFKIRHYSK